MGVVVQVMVPAEKAGVLFTHHPVSGAAHQILITANYGLGETVVSAQVEPDMIVLERDWQDNLSIAETSCGTKRHRMQMDDEGGVTSHEIESSESKQLCLYPEEILRLGKIGIELENAYGGPRDIEWAIVNDDVHLLQSRPITSLDAWTPSELLHELDGAIPTDTEVQTIGNTGEVFPKLTSPLAQSILIPVLDKAVCTSAHADYCRHCSNTINTSHHRVLLNVHNTMYRALEEKMTTAWKVGEIAIYGHVASTPELFGYGLERYGTMTNKGKIMNLVDALKNSVLNNRRVKKAEEVLKSIKMNDCKYTTPEMLYLAITQNINKLLEVAHFHSWTSRVSVFSQIVAMSILTEGSEDLTTEHYNDISLLLSSCSDVVSAEVPTDIKAIADCIAKSERGAEFCSLPPDLAVEWLQANTGEVAAVYKKFISKHGYRCIQEFDFMSETWSMKPDDVVGTIQTMVSSYNVNEAVKEVVSAEDTVMRLKSVKHDKTRKVLSLLLPWCRRTVASRERTKASFIGVVHQLRLAYRRLAQMLVAGGRLPDAHLIFFLTHYELGQLLATRSAALIAKAGRRQRLWPQWEKLKLPEMVIGLPKPIDTSPLPRGEGDGEGVVRLKGTPVWAGTVMGRACVVHHLGEISQLRKGDILVTRSTDIGWSPYFPLLGGVVTELGGLISHGAVVAREYGLPCIVGVEGATDHFKTGDTVLLVGTTGTLEKVDS
ncbi:hypothetical protein R5R35_009486 [Gryllus longicercus]